MKIQKDIRTRTRIQINELKVSVPHWFWNLIVKLISLGKIDLNEYIYKSEIYGKINDVENRLNVFQNLFSDIYINDYKRRKYKNI